jgi:hypothetical protein
MKTPLIIILICLFSFSVWAKRKPVEAYTTITGKVTTTADYCGGARPSEEMLEQLRTPKPAIRRTIYIKYGSVNTENTRLIKKVMTDSNGLFTVKLKKGYTYQFLEEWQCLNFKMPQQTQWVKWDEKCFRERYATPNYVLNTKKTKQNIITFNYHQPCFYNPYCGNYSGPLPP